MTVPFTKWTVSQDSCGLKAVGIDRAKLGEESLIVPVANWILSLNLDPSEFLKIGSMLIGRPSCKFLHWSPYLTAPDLVKFWKMIRG
jgi:hypothetical protein